MFMGKMTVDDCRVVVVVVVVVDDVDVALKNSSLTNS